MTVDEVIAQLREMGDPRALKIWARMDMDTTNYLGVGLTKIKNFAKKIKKNHVLSEELWNTGIRDARLLSFAIADPKELSKEELLAKASELDFWDLTDNFCSFIVVKSTYGLELAEYWRHSESEMEKRCAFVTISGIAKTDNKIEDEVFTSFLEQIGEEIRTAQNWVKESMIIATMSIGVRNINLYKLALETAENYGEIVVDYGETSCVAPNALNYLRSDRAKDKVEK